MLRRRRRARPAPALRASAAARRRGRSEWRRTDGRAGRAPLRAGATPRARRRSGGDRAASVASSLVGSAKMSVGDARFAHAPVEPCGARETLALGEPTETSEQSGPMRPHPAIGIEHLVVGKASGRLVGAEQIWLRARNGRRGVRHPRAVAPRVEAQITMRWPGPAMNRAETITSKSGRPQQRGGACGKRIGMAG